MMDKYNAEGHAENAMRDWPKVLKLNAAAADLAPAIYYARCLVYGDAFAPEWALASTELRQSYLKIAERVLSDLGPQTFAAVNSRNVPCLTPQTKMHVATTMYATDKPGIYEFTLTPEQTRADMVNIRAVPQACVKCGTRDQHKHYAPYCSHICEQAAIEKVQHVCDYCRREGCDGSCRPAPRERL
jgi:hypothetical protein